MTIITCPKCTSTKFKNFIEIKGKYAKIKCICGHIYWTGDKENKQGVTKWEVLSTINLKQ